MSFNDYPISLKPLVPYLQRANEFEKRAPIVSFYCRTYAAQLGISIIQSQDQADDEATNILTTLMDQLEQDKEQLNIEAQEDEAKSVVEVFALKVFKKADDADRAGRQDTQIAKLYYAASILIEVTKQFGDLTTDMIEKQKYAKWRAAEIQKSVRTGQPVPPVASEETAEEEDEQLQYCPTQQTSNTESNEEDEVTRYLMEQQQLLNGNSSSSGSFNQFQQQPTSTPQWNLDNYAQQQGNNRISPTIRDDAMKMSPTTPEEQSFPSWNQPQNNIRATFNISPPTQFEPPKQTFQQPQTFVPQQQPQTQFNQSPVFNQQPQQQIPPTFVPKQPTVSPTPQTNFKPVQSQSPVSNNSSATNTPTSFTTTTQPVQPVQSYVSNGTKKEVSLDDMMKAQKLCKFAISSLQFEDVETAKKNLIDALNLLN